MFKIPAIYPQMNIMKGQGCMKGACMGHDTAQIGICTRDLTVLDTALGYVQCLLNVSMGFLNISRV